MITCPGCRHRDLDRWQSEKSKRDWLAQCLSSQLADGADLADVEGVSDDRRIGYRDRVCLRAQWSPDEGSGKSSREVAPTLVLKLGLRVFRRIPGSRKRIEDVVDIPTCPIHSERVRAIQRTLCEFLPREALPLLYVLISGALLTLVLKSSRSAPLEDRLRSTSLANELKRAGVRGFFLNFNPSAGEKVIAPRGWVHLWGEALEQDASGLWHGPESFRQLIPELYEKALVQARAFLNPAPGDSVVDLCSGGGATLKIWQEAGARSIGVELGAESVRCAEMNLGRSAVLRGRVSERLPQLDEWISSGGRRLLFANPPRLGLEESVTRWIGEVYRPEKIAYLSCSAGTLSRDLSVLGNSGYALRKITPYDFFPGTHHIEALALVERAP